MFLSSECQVYGALTAPQGPIVCSDIFNRTFNDQIILIVKNF